LAVFLLTLSGTLPTKTNYFSLFFGAEALAVNLRFLAVFLLTLSGTLPTKTNYFSLFDSKRCGFASEAAL